MTHELKNLLEVVVGCDLIHIFPLNVSRSYRTYLVILFTIYGTTSIVCNSFLFDINNQLL